MVATTSLAALSSDFAGLVDAVAGSVVAVDSGGSWSTSGMLWRPGIVVTAEEVLEREESIQVTLAGGRRVAATLIGRDPSTDVAALRLEADPPAIARTADAGLLKTGHLVLAVGSHGGQPVASLGIVGFAGGAWQSQRGGTIDHLITLDLTLSPAAEGAALLDTAGQVLGMAVSGPRRKVLAIPASTVDRALDQLLAKGYVGRGYLGAGLQHVRLNAAGNGAGSGQHGVLVISVDPKGPAAEAGLLVGDIVTTWDAKPVTRGREVMRFLGPDSIGNPANLELLGGGA